MELGEINSGESSKNQLVEIQIEGNIQFLYNKNKISLKSFHSPFRVSKIILHLNAQPEIKILNGIYSFSFR